MKLLAFAASNSPRSINRQLVQFGAQRLAEQMDGLQVHHIDLADVTAPIYSPAIEDADGIPQAALNFSAAIGGADGVLISFAEHNGYATAAWKNLFDWMSRHDRFVWQEKPLVMLAASPGKRAGASVLAAMTAQAPRFGGHVAAHQGFGPWGICGMGRPSQTPTPWPPWIPRYRLSTHRGRVWLALPKW